MKNRPKLKLQKTKIDLTIDVLTWFLLLLLCTYTIVVYSTLPSTIPIHFNSIGKADGFGNKAILFITPIIAMFLILLLSLVSKIPHQFNYPVKITPENALKQYELATKLIRNLKLIIVLIFCQATVSTIWTAQGKKDGLGMWFLPLSIGIIFTFIILFTIKSKKNKALSRP
jgi:uncharacterized membrane protein